MRVPRALGKVSTNLLAISASDVVMEVASMGQRQPSRHTSDWRPDQGNMHDAMSEKRGCHSAYVRPYH